MGKTDEIIKLKELLDKGAITQEEFDTKKAELLNGSSSKASGAANKILKAIGIIAICFVAIIILGIAIGSGNDSSSSDTGAASKTESVQMVEKVEKTESKKAEQKPAEKIIPEFAEAVPVLISGHLEEDMLGYPNIICDISNLADKDIAAVCLYFIPYDVYGDTINTIFTTNKLDSNDKIYAGSTVERKWSTLDSDIKSGTMYLYSVYFEDGTEWGNRNASKSDIMKYAYKFDIKGE